MSVLHVSAGDGEWYPNSDGAGRFRVLRVHDGGGVTVEVELASGSKGATHEHPRGEELVVMSGRLVVDDVELARVTTSTRRPGEATRRGRSPTHVSCSCCPRFPSSSAATSEGQLRCPAAVGPWTASAWVFTSLV
jgi:hypothetical protein